VTAPLVAVDIETLEIYCEECKCVLINQHIDALKMVLLPDLIKQLNPIQPPGLQHLQQCTHRFPCAHARNYHHANVAAAATCSVLVQKASTSGALIKQEKAQLLGKSNCAELSLASKMATFDQAMALLTQLRDSSHAVAVKELNDLRTFAAERLSLKEEIMPWDVSFFAERLREAEFDFNEEELRPYVVVVVVVGV
jgi:hypothetical protein